MDKNENNASHRRSTAIKRKAKWSNAKRGKRVKSQSFLEQLRAGLLEQSNGKLSKDFLIKHQAEFPAKIRVAIASAVENQKGEAVETRRQDEFAGKVKRTLQQSLLRKTEIRATIANAAGKQKQEIVDELQQYFLDPAKIRAAITKAMEQQEEQQEKEFIVKVKSAVRKLFLGRTFDESNQNWYGLDSSIDKESEVEALIHCFPWILNERFQLYAPGDHRWGASVNPIQMLMSRKEALSFIPLFVKMNTTMSSCPILLKLFFPQRWLFSDLFGEAFVSNSRIFDDRAIMQEYSNEALSILSHLIEQEHMSKKGAQGIVHDIFMTDFSFVVIEPIFRKIINWYPSALYGSLACLLNWYSPKYFVEEFFGGNGRHRWNESHIQMFETILDLGMTHFPKQLGFVFHKRLDNRQPSNRAFPTIFHMLMEWSSVMEWSSEKILKIIHDKMFNNRGLKTLPSLVIKVASNDGICLDGLYELIRFNPTDCLRVVAKKKKKRTTRSSRNRANR